MIYALDFHHTADTPCAQGPQIGYPCRTPHNTQTNTNCNAEVIEMSTNTSTHKKISSHTTKTNDGTTLRSHKLAYTSSWAPATNVFAAVDCAIPSSTTLNWQLDSSTHTNTTSI